MRAARVGAAEEAAAEATAASVGAAAGSAAGGASAAGVRVVVARPRVAGPPAAAAAAAEESVRARARGAARADGKCRRSTHRSTRHLSATGPRSPASRASCSMGKRRLTSSCSPRSRRLSRRPCALAAAWSVLEGSRPLQRATHSTREPSESAAGTPRRPSAELAPWLSTTFNVVGFS